MIFCAENRVVIWRDRKKKYKKVITRIKWKRSYKSWLDRAVFLKFDFQVLINNDGLVYCMDCSLQHKFWYCIFTKQWQSHIATLLFFKLNPLLLLLLMKWFLHRRKKKNQQPLQTTVFLTGIQFNIWHVFLTSRSTWYFTFQ